MNRFALRSILQRNQSLDVHSSLYNKRIYFCFRLKFNENDILAAARLKILKACIEASADSVSECLDAQTARCGARLRERSRQPDGDTEARRYAMEHLPSLRDELLAELTSGRLK